MNHKMLRPFIVKVSVLGYFPLYIVDKEMFLSLILKAEIKVSVILRNDFFYFKQFCLSIFKC